MVIVLICLGFLTFLDAPATYRRYVGRCINEPTLKECGPLNPSKPPPSLVEGIVLDKGSGRWAILLAPLYETDASSLFDRLSQQGVAARRIRVPTKKRIVRIQLQLGHFETKNDAAKAGTELKKRGVLTDFVVGEYRPES